MRASKWTRVARAWAAWSGTGRRSRWGTSGAARGCSRPPWDWPSASSFSAIVIPFVRASRSPAPPESETELSARRRPPSAVAALNVGAEAARPYADLSAKRGKYHNQFFLVDDGEILEPLPIIWMKIWGQDYNDELISQFCVWMSKGWQNDISRDIL